MMKCVAVDDEPLALNQLKNYIMRVPFLELVGTCHSAFEAIDVLSKEKAHLVFVDINMPDMNGLNFVKSLEYAPMVIFTTAYSEYALEGFKVNAVDYLLKPFGFDDFVKSVNRAKSLMEMRQHSDSETAVSSGQNIELGVNDNYVFVKSDYRIVRIHIPDIKYVESMSEYVRIYLEGHDKPVMTLVSMKKLEECLPKNSFMRVHRSYLVNLQKIEEVSRMRIVFDGTTFIPVGELYKDKLMEYINQNFLGKN